MSWSWSSESDIPNQLYKSLTSWEFWPPFTPALWLMPGSSSIWMHWHHGLGDTPWRDTTPDTIHYLGLLAFSLAWDELETLIERLNLRVHQRNILRQVYKIKRSAGEIAKTKQASALYHLVGATSDDARLIAWLALDNENTRQQIIRFQIELRDVAPLIDGNYLKQEMNLQPGPIFKTIIDALRDARLDGLVTSLNDERTMVEQILAETSKP